MPSLPSRRIKWMRGSRAIRSATSAPVPSGELSSTTSTCAAGYRPRTALKSGLMFSRSLYVGIAISSASGAVNCLQHVKKRTSAEGLGLPEAGLGEARDRLVGIRRAHQAERAAVGKEAAECHPAGAARLDQREGGHLDIDGESLDDRRTARSVDHHWRQLPWLEEVGEALRRVRLPNAARVVRIVLDEARDVRRLVDPVEEVGSASVWRGAAGQTAPGRTQVNDALQMGGTRTLATRQVVVDGGDADVIDDHGVTQPPAKGTTWPTKKSASSDAR